MDSAGWLPNESLEQKGCPSSDGIAYLHLATSDNIRLLLTACATAQNLGGDYIFVRECFRLLGQSLVHAIERIRLRGERELLARIGSLAVENQSRRLFFDTVAREVAQAFDSQGCSVFLYDPYRNRLILGGTTGLYNPSTNQPLSEEELAELTYERSEGLTGKIFADSRAIRMYDATDEAEWKSLGTGLGRHASKSAEGPYEAGKARPFLGAPISFPGKAGEFPQFVGVIRLHGRRDPACFLPSDERRLEAVSAELALAVQHWDGEIASRDLRRSQDAVQEQVRSLLVSDSGLQSVLRTITEQAKRLFQGCAASVLLKTPDRDELVVECDVADRPRLPAGVRVVVPLDSRRSLCAFAALQRTKPVMVPDVSKDDRFNALIDLGAGLLSDVRSEACAAIVLGDRLLGVLNVDSDQVGRFHPGDRWTAQMLERLASEAAIVIHRGLSHGMREWLYLPSEALLHQFTNDLASFGFGISELDKALADNVPATASTLGRLKDLAAQLSRYWQEMRGTPVFDKPSRFPTLLNEEVEKAAEFIRSRLKAKRLQFEQRLDPALARGTPGGEVRVFIDRLMFNLILSIFVSNAADIAPPRSRIRIATQLLGAKAVLSVEDYGPGVPLEYREKLFKVPFSTKEGGSGEGLLLAARMARTLDATCEYQPGLKRGSKFLLALPVFQGERK